MTPPFFDVVERLATRDICHAITQQQIRGRLPLTGQEGLLEIIFEEFAHRHRLDVGSGRSYFVRPEPLLAKDVFTAMHQRLEQPLLLDEERPICGPFERPSPFTNIARTKPTGV